MKLSKILLLLPPLACALPCEAAWLTQLTPTRVGSADLGGEYTWFSTSSTVSNPASCPNSDIYVIRSLPRNALAILLAAHTSGKSIQAYVSDSSCDTTGRPLVTSVATQD
jgi:hypothetical protein